MTPAVHTLTKGALESQLDEFIDVGADVSPWREPHLRADLPEKWRLSFYIGDERPIGYAIMSLRGSGWIHLHQLMVAQEYRGRGLGALMIAEAKLRCARDLARLSLKVPVANLRSTRFYVREGMQVGDAEGDYLWMFWPDRPEIGP